MLTSAILREPPRSSPQELTSGGKVIDRVAPDERERALRLKSFKFRHRLAHAGAFSLDDVRRAARRLVDEKRFDQVCGFSRGKEFAPQNVFQALDAMAAPEETNTWVRLTRVDEVVPEFRNVVTQFYADLSDLHQRDIETEVFKPFVTLFVSSPNEVTPYHLDHTWNFLHQLWGSKVVHLYDPDDPAVMSQADLENFYVSGGMPVKRDGARSIAYELRPGDAVHHPVNAPHWVQNGPEISISLSLGLCLHRANRDARIHQVNNLLRRAGIRPAPLGHSHLRDSLKELLLDSLGRRNANSFEDVVFSGYRRLMSPARAAMKLKRALSRAVGPR